MWLYDTSFLLKESEIGLTDQMTVQVHSQTQIDEVVELMRLFNLIFFLTGAFFLNCQIQDLEQDTSGKYFKLLSILGRVD